jgi:signal transduction histidine kinase
VKCRGAVVAGGVLRQSSGSLPETAKRTGMDLTVVKKIVERHGGRVWVESEVGRKSTFFITLPKQPMETHDGQI